MFISNPFWGVIAMEKIVLNEFGEALLEYPCAKITDKTELSISVSNCVGIHEICRGWIDFIQVSENYFVLHCRRCGRITFQIPKQVDTFGKLRQWCKEQSEHSEFARLPKRLCIAAKKALAEAPPTTESLRLSAAVLNEIHVRAVQGLDTLPEDIEEIARRVQKRTPYGASENIPMMHPGSEEDSSSPGASRSFDI